MNASEIHAKIGAAKERCEWLGEWINTLEAARTKLLASLPDPRDSSLGAALLRQALKTTERGYIGAEFRGLAESVAESLRRGQPGLEDARDEVRRLGEQIEVLTEKLPSAAEIARAERERSELVDRSQAASTATAEASAELLRAISALQPLALALVARKQTEAQHQDGLVRLVAEYGLKVGTPTVTSLDVDQARQAQLVLELARQALNVAAGSARRLSPQTVGALATASDGPGTGAVVP